MTQRFDVVRRIEPQAPLGDLDRGFAAESADPVWFLGRQWQLGEHQGENASSPVLAVSTVVAARVSNIDARPGALPENVPAESLIEGEPDDWWTPRRRVELGRRSAAAVGDRPELRCRDLAPPYDRFNRAEAADGTVTREGEYDGRAIWLARAELALPASLFADVPALRSNMWRPPELAYDGSWPAGGGRVLVEGHRGGELDWWSATMIGVPAQLEQQDVRAVPTRLTFPGAPAPRWWQIEDHSVDIAGYPPDRAHLATMLLIDIVCSHTNDWFVFPVPADVATVVGVPTAQIIDGFGHSYPVAPPGDWSLQRVSAPSSSPLGPAPMLVAVLATTPLVGDDFDEVAIGVDEEANVLWGVERRVAGIVPPLGADEIAVSTAELADKLPTGPLDYQPTGPMEKPWFPYLLEAGSGPARFVPHRLANLRADDPVPFPPPRSPFFTDGSGHVPAYFEIAPRSVPNCGLRLTRRWVLARAVDGAPVLWHRRAAVPLDAPPAKPLLFDVMEPSPLPD